MCITYFMPKLYSNIEELSQLLDKIDHLLRSNGKYGAAVERFKLNKKLIGPIGEAYALVEINKQEGIKDILSDSWKGGQTCSYDIVTSDKKKVQVKSSYEGRRFQIISIKTEDNKKKLKKAYMKVRHEDGKMFRAQGFKLPKEVARHFNVEFDNKYKQVDYWILVGIYPERREYFIVPNKEMRN